MILFIGKFIYFFGKRKKIKKNNFFSKNVGDIKKICTFALAKPRNTERWVSG